MKLEFSVESENEFSEHNFKESGHPCGSKLYISLQHFHRTDVSHENDDIYFAMGLPGIAISRDIKTIQGVRDGISLSAFHNLTKNEPFGSITDNEILERQLRSFPIVEAFDAKTTIELYAGTKRISYSLENTINPSQALNCLVQNATQLFEKYVALDWKGQSDTIDNYFDARLQCQQKYLAECNAQIQEDPTLLDKAIYADAFNGGWSYDTRSIESFFAMRKELGMDVWDEVFFDIMHEKIQRYTPICDNVFFSIEEGASVYIHNVAVKNEDYFINLKKSGGLPKGPLN